MSLILDLFNPDGYYDFDPCYDEVYQSYGGYGEYQLRLLLHVRRDTGNAGRWIRGRGPIIIRSVWDIGNAGHVRDGLFVLQVENASVEYS